MSVYVLVVTIVIIVFMLYLFQYSKQKFNRAVKALFMIQTRIEDVGTLGTENFRLLVLTPQNLCI